MSTKKAVNLSLDADLLARARAEGVNLSAAFERSLKLEVVNLEIERWKRENANAILEANLELKRNGLWNEEYRLW
jgi:antitoxin CcdA